MISKHRKTNVVVKLTNIRVTQKHIDDGQCGLINQCMVRVAMEAYLREFDPTAYNHHTKVDAGHIRFHYQGSRWSADTPKVAKHALIQFDKESEQRAAAKRLNQTFVSKVKPFSFSLVATRISKVERMSRERQIQINEARKKRQEAGKPDRRYAFRKRVVGFA